MKRNPLTPKHDFGIVIASFFIYLIGMVPGFLLATSVLGFNDPGGILIIGIISGLAIAAGFIKVASRIDLIFFGSVTKSLEK